jgi:hypothetical protein
MRCSLLLAGALFVSTPCFAWVRVGEVSSPRADALAALRAAAIDEVSKLKVRMNAIVSVSLVRLETKPGEVTCVVSAVVRSDDGNLYAILEGRAHARGSLESAVLRSAVHGAISRIPDALR